MNVIYTLIYNVIINKLPVYIDGKPLIEGGRNPSGILR